MSDAAEPRWELLPHDPQQFFDLPDEFDLGDLKRSYNRLIRRFKPEKFPAEFQRIRAAYEELNGALRYNISRRPAPLPVRRPELKKEPPRPEAKPPASDSPAANNPPPATKTPAAESSTSDLFAQHANSANNSPLASPADNANNKSVVPDDKVEEPTEVLRATVLPPSPEDAPHDTYARVKYLEPKSPDDYVTLALLADVVYPHVLQGQPESFLDWLFAGLADHPRDWSLTSLLRQYLVEEHDIGKIPALLLRVVDVLPHDRFQYVTEQAWDRLLREGSFDEFRDCLDHCGARLGRAVDRTQLVFYVHILKFALWKADAEFLAEIFATLEDNYHQLDRYSQGEFEMLAELRDYVAHREAFIARGPCCARIDQAMRDWCTLSESAGDLSVLDCQYFINGRGKRLCDEFPDADAELSFVLVPWDHIVSDVLERLGEPPAANLNEVTAHARDYLVRHSRRLSRSLRNNVGTLGMLVAFALFLVVVVATISFVVRAGMNFYNFHWGYGLLDFLWATLTFVVGAVVSYLLLIRTRQHTTFKYDDVRRDLIALFRVAALPTANMATLLERYEGAKYGDSDKVSGTEIITAGLRRDAALQIFSLAQICLRAADVQPDDAPLIIL